MSLDSFADLPRKVHAALKDAGIEVEIVHDEQRPDSQIMAMAYPPPVNKDDPPHDEWKLPQEKMAERAEAFFLHCFSMWAKEGLAGRKKIVVSDAMVIPRGIDIGTIMGDETTIPIRILRFYHIAFGKYGYRADVLVTEFI